MAESRKGQNSAASAWKSAGFFLLVTGWLLVIAAIAMLKQPTARAGFAAAGMAVEAVGLVLVARSHIAPRPERR